MLIVQELRYVNYIEIHLCQCLSLPLGDLREVCVQRLAE